MIGKTVAMPRAALLPAGNPMHLRYLFLSAAASIFTFAAAFEEFTGTSPHDPDVLERPNQLVLRIFSADQSEPSVSPRLMC